MNKYIFGMTIPTVIPLFRRQELIIGVVPAVISRFPGYTRVEGMLSNFENTILDTGITLKEDELRRKASK